MKIWTIYRKEDFEKNKKFVDYLRKSCEELCIEFELKFLENFVTGIKNNKPVTYYNNVEISDYPNAIINRTNNYFIAHHLEFFTRCFNDSTLTKIANNKNLCYQIVSKSNAKIQDTLFNYSNTILEYPLVVKNPFGRGGNEVFLINNEKELNDIQKQFPDITLQSYCKSITPKDLRVYVINNKIVAAILRKGTKDFRANYSISHTAEVYTLSKEETDYINNIISYFKIDYAGIDFLINDKNELIFNEIEDSVGARALYELTNINIAKLYIEHIYSSICNKEEGTC